jgi:hypothetical protein
MAICELEPVLSTADRPDEPPRNLSDENSLVARNRFRANPTSYNFRLAFSNVEVQRVSRDNYPKRKEHPQLAY